MTIHFHSLNQTSLDLAEAGEYNAPARGVLKTKENLPGALSLSGWQFFELRLQFHIDFNLSARSCALGRPRA